MSSKPIIIVGGEPQSVFIEILLKAIKKIKKHIILITSKKILKENMKKFNKSVKFNDLNENLNNIAKKKINLINIDYNKFSFSKRKITSDSNKFIKISFDKALEIMKKIECSGLINGPISKKTFLKGKFNGIWQKLQSLKIP